MSNLEPIVLEDERGWQLRLGDPVYFRRQGYPELWKPSEGQIAAVLHHPKSTILIIREDGENGMTQWPTFPAGGRFILRFRRTVNLIQEAHHRFCRLSAAQLLFCPI